MNMSGNADPKRVTRQIAAFGDITPIHHKVVALVPVGSLERGKSRLSPVLDAQERRDLVLAMFTGTLTAAMATPGIADTIVVTPDSAVEVVAEAAGARVIRQGHPGLNRGLEEARDVAIAAGATAILVLLADLPGISSDAIGSMLAACQVAEPPVVGLVPDRHGRGTNALFLAPPNVIQFGFGGGSRAAHRDAATTARINVVEVRGPLSLDIDTPEDLRLYRSDQA